MAARRCIALVCALLGCLLSPWLLASETADIEAQIKAAYLYKFSAYVEWPATTFAQADSPIIIGVIGADAVASALGNLQQTQPATSRALKVRLLKADEPVSAVQMLFIGSKESAALKRVQDSAQAGHVLTVTDQANALASGSIINFVNIDDHIRFEVSVAQAERSGLKISSRLLNVAQKIQVRRP